MESFLITQLGSNQIIKRASEMLLITAREDKQILSIDPKTLGVLDTFIDDNFVTPRTLVYSDKFDHIISFQVKKTMFSYWTYSKKKIEQKSFAGIINCCALSNSEYLFAGASKQGFVYLWDTLSGDLLKNYNAHYNSAITKILFLHDDGAMITGGEDGKIYLWAMSQVLPGKNNWRSLLTGSNSDMNSEEVKYKISYLGHTAKISDIVISRNSINKMYSASKDGTIIVWDLGQGFKINVLSVESPINCLELNVVEDYLFAGCQNGAIHVKKVDFNIDRYKKESTDFDSSKSHSLNKIVQSDKVLKEHKSEVLCMVIYKEENLLISGDKDGLLIFWNQEGQISKKFSLIRNSISNLVLARRPLESDTSLLPQNKKMQIKRFKGIEDGKVENGAQTFIARTLRKKNSSIQKSGKKIKKLKRLNSKQYYLETKAKITGAESSGGSRKTGIYEEEIKFLKEENLKLKQINHQIFNKYITLKSKETD